MHKPTWKLYNQIFPRRLKMSKTKVKGFSVARSFKNDEAAVNNGVWREVFDGSARLLVARYNNDAHTAYLRTERAKEAKLLENSESEEAQKFLEDLGNRALAKHILKGWEGILDEDGETEVLFSEEAAYKLLTDYVEFSNLVFSLSMEVDQYRAYAEGKAVKN